MDFNKILKQLEITLTEEQLNQFKIYFEYLVEYNENVNLTSITEINQVYIKHFYDSLTLAKSYDFSKEITMCDVGAGAGFPSIPLKILYPNIKLTIVDSLGKRITFLNLLAEKLKLTNYNMVHDRAEEFAKTNRESFDIVTARAVARQNVLNELCLPLTKVNGYFLSMKAKDAINEYEEGESFKILNAKIEEVLTFELPNDEGQRNIIKIKHTKACPKEYPREYGKIKKKPL
ncbi:MAG: 16S rRNA (guanine(527)-N(7))-methyltransferase RsmG [bacterium]